MGVDIGLLISLKNRLINVMPVTKSCLISKACWTIERKEGNIILVNKGDGVEEKCFEKE